MRPNIKAMFIRLNDEHFDGQIPDIPVVWNTRMTTTAGYCRYKNEGMISMRVSIIEPYKIDLSDKLFRNEGYDLAKIERTLIHEMVHVWQWETNDWDDDGEAEAEHWQYKLTDKLWKEGIL